MKKTEYRAVIKFLFLEGVAPKQIHLSFMKVYKDSSLSIKTVDRWVAAFESGHTSLEDDPCEGPLKSASTPETITEIQDMIMKDRRLTERDLVGVDFLASLGNVPHSLTMEQKRTHMRPDSHFRDGIDKIDGHWNKWIEVNGDYIKEQNHFCFAPQTFHATYRNISAVKKVEFLATKYSCTYIITHQY